MTTTRGSARYAGLLPVDPPDEPTPIRPTTLENDPRAPRQSSLRERASRVPSLLAFCVGVAGTCAWWSYGDATREMIANSYQQLGWLAPRQAATVQKALDAIAPAGSANPHPDQLDPMLGDDLRAIRLSLDRIVAGQELIARAVEEIATSIAAGKEQMTRNTDQTATRQEPTTRSSDQTATITTGQGKMTHNTDQSTPSAGASSIAVESQADGAALQPALLVHVKPGQAGPPQMSSERDKQLPAVSGHDASCFPSASAVLQNHPGASPAWTLRAAGHEGSQCWHVAAQPSGSDHRPRVSDHRGEIARSQETVGTTETTENRLFASPARYAMPPE
jgi:hypothetical protein